MIHYKNEEQIELMRHSATLVSKCLTEVAHVLRPGMATLAIDKMIAEFIKDNGGTPSFLNYHGYPFNSCISVNDVVVHGFPNGKELKDGDGVWKWSVALRGLMIPGDRELYKCMASTGGHALMITGELTRTILYRPRPLFSGRRA